MLPGPHWQFGNCVFWALFNRIFKGGQLRIVRSPVYPLLPRASWSPDGRAWYRYHLRVNIRRLTWRQKWLPLHAVLFRGKVISE